ncbi:MAG: cupredoxin domain-containing protein, partial [Mycobacterium sp.]
MGIYEVIVIAATTAILGFLGWFFFGPKTARRAHLVSGAQEVDITVKGGYSPNVIRVTEGVPLRLRFDRQESGDCTSRVVFADFGASKTLPAFGTATLEFTPDKVGEFDFACGMNMIHGTLIVEPSGGPRSMSGDSGSQVAPAVGVGPSTEAAVITERVEFRVAG